jgi:hypothetical protein
VRITAAGLLVAALSDGTQGLALVRSVFATDWARATILVVSFVKREMLRSRINLIANSINDRRPLRSL